MDEYTARCLRQHHEHAQILSNGSHLVSIPHTGIYDLFDGKGWQQPIRFRLIYLRDSGMYQVQHVSGSVMANNYKRFIVKELFGDGTSTTKHLH